MNRMDLRSRQNKHLNQKEDKLNGSYSTNHTFMQQNSLLPAQQSKVIGMNNKPSKEVIVKLQLNSEIPMTSNKFKISNNNTQITVKNSLIQSQSNSQEDGDIGTPKSKKSNNNYSIHTNVNATMVHRNQLMRREVQYKDTITRQQNEILELQEEVDKLKSYLRNILDNNDVTLFNKNSSPHSRSTNVMMEGKADHIHSIYQDLYITDLKVEVEQNSKDMQYYRQKLQEKEIQNSMLIKEIKDMKRIIDNYRRIFEKREKATKIQSQQQQLYNTSYSNYNNSNKMFDQELQTFRDQFQQSPSRIGRKRDAIITLINSNNNIKDQSNDPAVEYQAVNLQSLDQNQLELKMQQSSLETKSVQMNQADKDSLYHSIRQILKSSSVRGLFKNTYNVIKKQLGCSNIYFLLMSFELINQAKKDKLQIQTIRVEQYNLELLLLNIQKDNFHLKFNEIKQAFRGIMKDKLCIHSFHKLSNMSEYDLIMQLEHDQGQNSMRFTIEDRQFLSIVGNLFSNVYERLKNLVSAKESLMRSYQFLDTFKVLLAERNHTLLYYNIEKIFPSLFNYEYVGVLFRDEKKNDLYALRIDDPTNPKILEENMLRFPMTIGFTGRAISKRKVLISLQGEKGSENFSSEIDNFLNVPRIRNMMVGPIEDMNGEIRGVIQFINKKDKPSIDASDEIELKTIIPALGEMIKTADETLKIINISAGLSQSLGQINQTIYERTEIVQAKSMPMISGSIKYMSDLITILVHGKKEAVFSDNQMMHEVFRGIRNKMLAQNKNSARNNNINIVDESNN
ncbi:UNKNOWN [Stylonychia lemnae]|uniref:GAF domain-containing protein n=1 Tax=Stylonychia lemnae TaxID=5949 RepID=A0A078AZ67_STYLE|nr:UNKNOWN [Stylonychia lemnae]|eukprot:CDW86108.1 UNKNOWN [Stylonychia lemnae]